MVKTKAATGGFYKKGVLKKVAKFTGKQLRQSLFFNKVTGRPATLLKKRPRHRCFPVNFPKFFGTPFLQNTGGCFRIKIIVRKNSIQPISYKCFGLLQYIILPTILHQWVQHTSASIRVRY